MRPVSNVSNNSSHSSSRPISNVPLNIIQGKLNENRNMFINPVYGNKKPLSPSRLVPSPPPANIIHNYTNNPPSTPRNNIPNKSPNIPIIQPTNNNRNPNLQITGSPSLNMHTSDVKIVYQRGSFYPNSPHSSEDNHSVSQSSKHIDVNTEKNINVNKEYLN